jgi:WXG100 family type VII secretion target
MARRTVDQAALVEMAGQMQQFCDVMVHRLDDVVRELRRLEDTWGGVAFEAFLERLEHWHQWATEMGEVVDGMQRNAHIAHRNYAHNSAVNTAMWGG